MEDTSREWPEVGPTPAVQDTFTVTTPDPPSLDAEARRAVGASMRQGGESFRNASAAATASGFDLIPATGGRFGLLISHVPG